MSMNELNCKRCNRITTGHDDDVVAVASPSGSSIVIMTVLSSDAS